MRMLIIAAGLLAFAGMSLAQEKGVTFATVMHKDGGGPTKATAVVIRSEKDWKAFIETISSQAHRARLATEKFDFAKELVIAVARGGSQSVPTREDGVSKVSSDGDRATVEWTVIESDQRKNEESYPFHVIKMPRFKEIQFKKIEKTVGG